MHGALHNTNKTGRHNMNQETLTQLTQKNIARGFKASQTFFKGAEQLFQLQLNYIRQNLDEQAKFAQQFDINTLAQDTVALQQTRTQRINEVAKDAFHIATNMQTQMREIADEQQTDLQQEMKSGVESFSPTAFYDPALLQKTFEQFWTNTTTAFDNLSRFTQTAAEEAKKATPVAPQAQFQDTVSGKK